MMEEAHALDRAMEDRVASRRSSASSLGMGMGAAWRSRYGYDRKRAGSVASTSNNSVISEDLIEVDEEQSLLGVGGGFTDETGSLSSANSPDDDGTSRYPPPSAPVWKTSFHVPPPPASATRATFDLAAPPKGRRRPPRLLAPVPSSPPNIVLDKRTASPDNEDANVVLVPVITQTAPSPATAAPPRKLSLRMRSDSRKPAPPPLHLRLQKSNSSQSVSSMQTPSQTLFVFPPSPTLRTPSTMTLSNMASGVPFPLMTPRVSTFRAHGRTRSFIGIAAPPTPTTAFTKVDVRGYVQS